MRGAPGSAVTVAPASVVSGAVDFASPKSSTFAAPAAVTQVNRAVPREMERLIARCHRKDPARRVQSMADLRSTLEELRDDLEAGRLSGSASVPIAPVRSRALRDVGLGTAAVFLLAAGAGAARVWLMPAASPAPLYRLAAMTSDLGVAAYPAVTPEGDLLAYASDRHDGTNFDIWVQPTAGGDPVRVTTDPADDSSPAFSPDGSRIAFRSEREGGGIYTVPALGGSERLLVPYGRTPRYSPDGAWLLYMTGGRGSRPEIFIMPAAGGEPQRVAPDVLVWSDAVWSPDSHAVFLNAVGADLAVEARMARVDARGVVREAARTSRLEAIVRGAGLAVEHIVDWRGDRVLFTAAVGSGGGLWSLPVDADSAASLRQIYSTTEQIGGVAMAADGRIFFAASTTRVSIAGIAVDGSRAAPSAPEALTRTVAKDTWPSISADGTTLAFISSRVGGGIWVKDMVSGRETQLPTPPGADSPVLSPDGRQVAYITPPAHEGIAVIDVRGGTPRQICDSCARYVSSWTPDGAFIVSQGSSRGRPAHLSAVEVATGKTSAITATGPTWFGRVSPDRRWIAFMDWPKPDRTREIVARFTPGTPIEDGAWIPVTDGQSVDETAAWSSDGRTLYFTSERDGFRCLYASPFDPDAGKVLGAPAPVLHLHGTRRTLVDTTATPSRIALGGHRLVFSLQEVVGNIWALTQR